MRTFRLFSLIITLFVFGFAIVETKAQDEMAPEDQRPPMARRPNLLQELNLSREQIQQIRRINQARKPLMQEAQMRFRQANRALDEAIYSDSPNEADIQARMKDVQLAQAEVIKIRTQSEYAIRKVLTPEQLVKFRELRERFMRRLQQNQPQNPPPNQMNEPNPRDINNPDRQNLNPLPRRRRGF